MFQLTDEYLNSPCVVRTLSNVVLATGYVSASTSEHIEINNPRDKMPLIKANSIVRIKITHKTKGPIFLIGVTYISNRKFLRIVEIESVAEFEKRAFFRVNTSIDAKFFKKTPGEVNLPEPQDIEIQNISLGGLYFSYEDTFEIGDNLVFEFHIDDSLLKFECEICRREQIDEDIDEPNLKYEYGCRFIECSNKQDDILCRFIFDQQREEIRRRREMLEITQE